MNREQILKQAQKENKGADLVALETLKKGSMIAVSVGIIISAILSILERCFADVINPAYYIINCSFMSALYLYRFIKLKKTIDLIAALIFIVFVIVFTTFWILDLLQI